MRQVNCIENEQYRKTAPLIKQAFSKIDVYFEKTSCSIFRENS